MKDCIFCKIVNKEIPSYKIYEDDVVYVFLDREPQNAGHTLIIPKNHVLDLDELDSELAKYIIDISKKIRNKLEDKLDMTGVSFVNNIGTKQIVKHFHLHLIPDYKKQLNFMSIEEVYSILKD